MINKLHSLQFTGYMRQMKKQKHIKMNTKAAIQITVGGKPEISN